MAHITKLIRNGAGWFIKVDKRKTHDDKNAFQTVNKTLLINGSMEEDTTTIEQGQ